MSPSGLHMNCMDEVQTAELTKHLAIPEANDKIELCLSLISRLIHIHSERVYAYE